MKMVESGNTVLQVSATEFRGKRYVDIRKMYESNGEFLPTPKGVMIPLDIVGEVLDAAEDELHEAQKPQALLPKVVYVVMTDTHWRRAKQEGLLFLLERQVFEHRSEAEEYRPRRRTGETPSLYKLKYGSVSLDDGKYRFDDPEVKRLGSISL